MKHLIGIKTTYPSMQGSRDSLTIINADRIDYVEYKPAYTAKMASGDSPIPQSLTVHFGATEPLVLRGTAADTVWNELKESLPHYMKVTLDDDSR